MTTIERCDPKATDWPQLVQNLYAQLDFPHNPALLPPQFVQVTFPKIGGQLFVVHRTDQIAGAAFLLPRGDDSGIRTYTLRYHPIADTDVDQVALVTQIKALLPNSKIVIFNPLARRTFASNPDGSKTLNSEAISIAPPTAAEVEEIRSVHQRIWQSPPGYLYPEESHCAEYGIGTSLIARANDHPQGQQIAGFVQGFYRFGGSVLPADWDERFNGAWRLESQSMGILPEFRGKRLAYRLKQKQADLARKDNIHLIHWTFDPLLFPNAMLNIGLLRGVVFDFHPDFYPFRNALNQVSASRFSITWLIHSRRVQNPPNQRARTVDLSNDNGLVRINDGLNWIVKETDASQIAIEIPVNWQSIQSKSIDLAQEWRTVTDMIFGRFIGCNANQYTITDTATDGERCYLIAERSTSALWSRLGIG